MTIDVTNCDLTTTRGRRHVLEQLPPDRQVLATYHALLVGLFRREIEYRRDEEAEDDLDGNCFEHIYWCALILYLVGDPGDVPLMWEAKQATFDTYCAFDSEFLVGAGVENTIKYLNDIGRSDIAQQVTNAKVNGMYNDLVGWEQFRINYFYPKA